MDNSNVVLIANTFLLNCITGGITSLSVPAVTGGMSGRLLYTAFLFDCIKWWYHDSVHAQQWRLGMQGGC